MFNHQRGERREDREDRRHERHDDREERRFERHEEHEERRFERHEDRGHQRCHDQDQPQYAPQSGAYNRADFVPDDDFNKMIRGGAFNERPRPGGEHIGPEDYGEWDQSRPPPNAGYQPSYQQQAGQPHQRFPEPPLPSIPHEQRASSYESSSYSQPSHDNYSVPESLEPRHGSSTYLPPAGAPGAGAPYSRAPAGDYSTPPGPPPQGRPSYGNSAYAPPAGAPPSSHAPAGGYSAPPGPPPSERSRYDDAPQGGSGRGAASDYYNGPPPGSAQSYSYTSDNAAADGDSKNPARYQQYHEAVGGSHGSYQGQQHNQSSEFDEEKYKSHFSAHAQAYGSGSDDRPMANDDIGAAAAIEALKITAATNQSGSSPQQGGRPQGLSSDAQYSQDVGGRPSGGKPQGRPQNAAGSGGKPQGRPQNAEDEDEGASAKPQAPSGGGGAQDKIVALAMAQAGKLFDKKGGGDNQGKSQAMQSAAATAMRLMGEYKSTGKVNMQPGEMQKLMGVAMSLF
ncbi:uncharacterized protein EDB91DRAFT_1168171 [Suillus paluster]|uniref:uncharacterized protein n=1 Tax=Suillus paluster TaxID=48578 RepID=UPI001B87ECBC|nr:uncharacterized protein EDB91DRAFT_1168171 [Suillus paluster]KAG1725478.1 hypothetical protein EDB91DRAFT_1168171 [Suillus paluster]